MNKSTGERADPTPAEQNDQPTEEVSGDDAAEGKRNLIAILTETAYIWLLLLALVAFTIYLAWGRS